MPTPLPTTDVLLVEPDAALRAALRDLLAEAGGYAVASVATGREAAAALAASARPLVTLVDADLPGPYNAAVLLALVRHARWGPGHAAVLLCRAGPPEGRQGRTGWNERLHVAVVRAPPVRPAEVLDAVAVAAEGMLLASVAVLCHAPPDGSADTPALS